MSIIESHSAVRPRIAFFHVVVGLVIAVLFGGLAHRQIFSAEGYLERERIQNQRRLLVPGARGEILDREGRVVVANRPRFSAVLFFSDARLRGEFLDQERRLVRDVREGRGERPAEGYSARARALVVQRYLDQCNAILGRSLQTDRRVLERHHAQQPLLPYPLVDDLAPPEFAALIEQLPSDSPVAIFTSTTRHYPYANAAAHTLGYITSTLDLPTDGLPGADLTTFYARGTLGRDGIERRFDPLLQGRTGSEIWIVDPSGLQVNLVENQPPVMGRPFRSSIDIDLQVAGENAFGTREGALVAMDVRTGEVLALVSRPDYDLNELTPFISRETFARIEDQGAWINRALQGLYPPGSPFKLVTAIAGLRAGVITPETIVDCPGYFMVGPRRFVCHRRSGHGPVDLAAAIRASCNVYFYKAALDTGVERLAAEANRFGLDRPTNIELPFETSKMLVPDPAWKRSERAEGWVPGDTANMAIGQGFLRLTPLQMTAFAASLARGETVTRPTIARQESGRPPIVSGNQALGLSPAHRGAILAGMEQAVQLGTAKFAAIPGVRIAGKTGTAQVRTPRGTLELAWFLGFAPADAPALAIVLVVVGEQPDEANAGGYVAAPIAKQVMEVYFQKNPPARPALPPALATR